jgi:hypothetical protein
LQSLTDGLKAVPFKEFGFSAAYKNPSEKRVFQQLVKPYPFVQSFFPQPSATPKRLRLIDIGFSNFGIDLGAP